MPKHLEQGEGRARQTRRAGSHLTQGEGGAGRKGASIPQKGGKIPANVPGPRNIDGPHTRPHPAASKKTPERGGGGVKGHDRINPNLGKPKSGSKDAQHPNLKPGLRPRAHKYLS